MERINASLFPSFSGFLENPQPEELRKAFQDLPMRSRLRLRCPWENRETLLSVLESLGAFAMAFTPKAAFREIEISAWKGKTGACHESGRSARYLGSGEAAMDDDGHLLHGAVRICEKTANLYSLPPYRRHVEVIGGDENLIARLEHDPAPFDCDRASEDASRLFDSLRGKKKESNEVCAVIYPGPFRFLILKDGSLLRRGKAVLAPTTFARDSFRRDGLLALPPHRSREAEPAPLFQDLYQRDGVACLLAAAVPMKEKSIIGPPDKISENAIDSASAAIWVSQMSDEMRARLTSMLERGEPYFILTGSDPADALGCCPSRLVGEANALVQAGILDRWREEAPPESCSTAFYALAGEISHGETPPKFTILPAPRDTLARTLGRSKTRRLSAPRAFLAGALVLLLAASLAISIRRCALESNQTGAVSDGTRNALNGNHALSERTLRTIQDADRALGIALGLRAQDETLVVAFFHTGPSCEPCRRMERMSRLVLETHFGPDLAAGRLRWASVDFGLAENRPIGIRLGAEVNTVGIIPVRRGRPGPWILLTEDVWRLLGDERAYSQRLRQAVVAARAGGA